MLEKFRAILKRFGHLLLNAFLVGGIVIGIAILISIAGEPYFDRPPVQVQNADPVQLGTFCPGQQLQVRKVITIEKPVVSLYYISVMDGEGKSNVIGEQTIYSGLTHPIPGTFTIMIPWRVPYLPPADYTLSFAARGTDTEERTVFVTNTFTLETSKEVCGDGD